MPFEPKASAAELIVYIDFKSPYAFIAIKPCFALEKKLKIQFDWRPLTLDIPSFLGSARLDKKGKISEGKEYTRSTNQWTQVKYAYRDARRYAALNGLTLRGTEKIWDSSLASIGLMWAKKYGHEVVKNYINLVYEPFWKRDLNIEMPRVITDKLAQAGAETEQFLPYLQGPGRIEHNQSQSKIFNAGIFGVPSFVIDNEIYFGREHLPRLEWKLTGKQGIAPDISYTAVRANPK